MKGTVLFLIFNRPELTSRVFEAIRQAEPNKLFIMADGPRNDVSGDIDKCKETRRVVEYVDWDCDVEKLFFNENLGCSTAVTKGINWFFEHVDQGIILEDDCLPDSTFFPYCNELLELYKNDSRIMHINGNNFDCDIFTHQADSYVFSSYPQVWGWATWRRSWALYDLNIKSWHEVKNNIIKNMEWNWYERLVQVRRFDALYNLELPYTWDYQWHLTVFNQNGLVITPKVNLISNIGFGKEATHTTEVNISSSKLRTANIPIPLVHPENIESNKKIDELFRRKIIGSPYVIFRMLKNRIRSLFMKFIYRI